MFGLRMHWWVFIGIALGVLLGALLHGHYYERIAAQALIDAAEVELDESRLRAVTEELRAEGLSESAAAEEARLRVREKTAEAVAAQTVINRDDGMREELARLGALNDVTGAGLTEQKQAVLAKDIQSARADIFADTTLGGFVGFLADAFLKLLRFIVVPLVFVSLVTGVLGLGDPSRLGRLGLRTLGWYMMTSLVAILTGLVLVNALQPGKWTDGLALPLGESPTLKEPEGLWQTLLNMLPSNPVGVAADSDLFGVIFTAIALGIATLFIAANHRELIANFFHALMAAIMKITIAILWLAPIGILALVAELVALSGIGVFLDLIGYVVTVALALSVHGFVTLPLIFWLFTKRNPYKMMGAMVPALLTGFSTASSSGTLPLTMERLRDNVGVKNEVGSFVLPLGATINMDGTALYEIVAVLFVAQLYAALPGTDFTITIFDQLIIVALALMVSIGAAGIPSAGLVMMVIIFQAVGLPLELTALLWSVDRLLDMGRTTVNIWSDSVGATTVAHFEGAIEEDKLFDQPQMATA
ncbi:MAG: cation:dicarboxylase symporter family transporter [Planctomycetota bacterium]